MARTRLDNDDDVEQWLDSLDPSSDSLIVRDAVHFRRIIAARQALLDAEDELIDAVTTARDAGDPWSMIGLALGVSRQAAQQRFGPLLTDRPGPDDTSAANGSTSSGPKTSTE